MTCTSTSEVQVLGVELSWTGVGMRVTRRKTGLPRWGRIFREQYDCRVFVVVSCCNVPSALCSAVPHHCHPRCRDLWGMPMHHLAAGPCGWLSGRRTVLPLLRTASLADAAVATASEPAPRRRCTRHPVLPAGRAARGPASEPSEGGQLVGSLTALSRASLSARAARDPGEVLCPRVLWKVGGRPVVLCRDRGRIRHSSGRWFSDGFGIGGSGI